jgi:hypothetical protein
MPTKRSAPVPADRRAGSSTADSGPATGRSRRRSSPAKAIGHLVRGDATHPGFYVETGPITPRQTITLAEAEGPAQEA